MKNIGREYTLSHLEESQINPNPFKQALSWLQEAKSSGELEPSAMSVATVDKTGRVSSRMMICKALDEEGFKFVSNYHSLKGEALAYHPQASIVFWWPILERQLRVEGIVTKMSSVQSDEFFASREYESQLSALISKQSEIMPDKEIFINDYQKIRDEYTQESRTVLRPSHWGGFILKPTYFEFWQGGPHRLHDRLSYIKSVNKETLWEIIRLYP